MPRVKRGTTANKRRKNLLEHTKGFKWSRKSKFRQAKEGFMHAQKYAYRDRRAKKRVARRSWQIQINAACRLNGTTYSKFINALKKSKIELDRKILAQLAIKQPDIFEKLVTTTKTK